MLTSVSCDKSGGGNGEVEIAKSIEHGECFIPARDQNSGLMGFCHIPLKDDLKWAFYYYFFHMKGNK